MALPGLTTGVRCAAGVVYGTPWGSRFARLALVAVVGVYRSGAAVSWCEPDRGLDDLAIRVGVGPHGWCYLLALLCSVLDVHQLTRCVVFAVGAHFGFLLSVTLCYVGRFVPLQTFVPRIMASPLVVPT